MNRYRMLFLYLLIFGYSPLSAAYTTYAQAQALGRDTEFFQSGSKIDQKIDANSFTADSFIYQVFGPSTTSQWTRRLQALGTASASPGVLKTSASAGAFIDAPAGIFSTSGLAEAGFTDSFTIRGSGPRTDLKVDYQVSGGLGGDAFAEGGLFFNQGGLFLDRDQFISFTEAPNGPRNFNCRGETCSGTLTLPQLAVGTTFFIKAYLKVYASAVEQNNLGLGNSSSADYSNTGKIFLSLADPNYQLVTNSGFNYSPVPLPASFWLFGSSLLAWSTRLGTRKSLE